MDTGIQGRKRWSAEILWSEVNKTTFVKEIRDYDLNKARNLIHETSKVLEVEGKLLRKFQRNRALRMERSKIISLIKISEFWISNKIKRGEALELLEKYTSKYEPRKDSDDKVIPELGKAFQMRDMLRNERINFTTDDYYLTYEEQIQKQTQRYLEFYKKPNVAPMFREVFNYFDSIKEKIESQSLRSGQPMIHFSFPDENGNIINTRDLLKKGPIVLSFFRGSWCPYCVNEMCVLTDSLPRINALGATLISLSPDVTALKYFRRLGVVGMIGLDKKMEIANKYRVVFPFDEKMKELYLKKKVDLGVFNDGGEWCLPIPATYIIDFNGVVAFDYVKIEYYKRLDPRVIVEVLTELFDKKMNEGHETILGKRKVEQITKVHGDEQALNMERVKKKLKVFDHTIM